MTIKLTDLQRVLLSTAAARSNGNLFPAVDSIAAVGSRIARTIPVLIKRGLVAEADVTDPSHIWREEGSRRIGILISDAGRTAIGVVAENIGTSDDSGAPLPVPAARSTKSAQVLALLQSSEGATLFELVAATGWLPHTTRAALADLRKKGHAIVRDKRSDATCYRIAEVA